MSNLGSTLTNYLATSKIVDAEFVRLTITDPVTYSGSTQVPGATHTYAFSNSYRTETIPATNTIGSTTPATDTFVALGGLVSISGHQRDLQVTSYDTQISLIGIDRTQIKNVLQLGLNSNGTTYHSGLKGGLVEIFRGFYDSNYQLVGTIQLRYTGVVTSYTIKEEKTQDIDAFSLTLQVSSYKTVLENRFAGRHTNGMSWNKFINPYLSDGVTPNPAYDTSMDRVYAIANGTFNFGQKLA